MSTAQVYKGGSPVVAYGQGAGDPILSGPPFGLNSLVRMRKDQAHPPFNATFNGAAGQFDYPAGCPLNPRGMRWQRNNLKHANVGAGDIIEMIVVPTNHYVQYVRFDVVMPDARLAGATVEVTGNRYLVDTADVSKFTVAEDPAFHNSQTDHGIPPIPLDVPSSSVFSMVGTSPVSATVDTTASNAATPVTSTGTQYSFPYYVAPQFITVDGVLERFEAGALLLGIKILTVPTDTDVHIWDALHDFYLTTRVTGFTSCSSL